MTGLELIWNVDLREHEAGHWVAVGVLGGARWLEPAGTFDVHDLGSVGLHASGGSPDGARGNLKAWTRLKTARLAHG